MTTERINHPQLCEIAPDGNGRDIAVMKATAGEVFKMLSMDLEVVLGQFETGAQFEVFSTGWGPEVFILNQKGGDHLARVLLQPDAGKRVTFLDGNAFNIARDNLTVADIPKVAYSPLEARTDSFGDIRGLPRNPRRSRQESPESHCDPIGTPPELERYKT